MSRLFNLTLSSGVCAVAVGSTCESKARGAEEKAAVGFMTIRGMAVIGVAVVGVLMLDATLGAITAAFPNLSSSVGVAASAKGDSPGGTDGEYTSEAEKGDEIGPNVSLVDEALQDMAFGAVSFSTVAAVSITV